MRKFIVCLVLLLTLTACYETTTEVITKEDAIAAELVKDLKFAGFGLNEDGQFNISEPDIYTVVAVRSPNDYLVESNRLQGGTRLIRFMNLAPDLFLMQVTPVDSRRSQLVLLQKKGGEFLMLTPDPYNDQNIHVLNSQKAFADQLGITFEGQGLGPFHLTGDAKKIRRFMHSLTTLPLQVNYKFKPL